MNSEHLERMLAALTPAAYHNLKRAVELGKWPDGQTLTDQQRQTCLEAVIVYEHRYLAEDKRSGQISGSCASRPAPPEQPLNWRE